MDYSKILVWVLRIVNILPKKMIVNLIISQLRKLAQDTDNDIDDALVDILETILNEAVGVK